MKNKIRINIFCSFIQIKIKNCTKILKKVQKVFRFLQQQTLRAKNKLKLSLSFGFLLNCFMIEMLFL
jgi:hypothetical protein